MMPVASIEESKHLKAAIRYAEKYGFSVFPIYEPVKHGDRVDCACPKYSKTRDKGVCTTAAKHPRTPRGFLDASRDLEQIKRWWRDWPRANIGIATAGLFIVDVDPRNGGDDTLADLIQNNQPLPDAPITLTGGGGKHIWFKRPELPQGFKLKSALGAGVEIKSDGGYVVAPPSVHASGGSYTFELSAHLEDHSLHQPPSWLVQLALKATNEADGASTSKVVEGLIGKAFQEAGWFIREIAGNRAAVRCPWEDEHTSGTRGDSSTVVFAPKPGRTRGYFHCSHAHCAHRSQDEVLQALPKTAVAAAKKAVPPPRVGHLTVVDPQDRPRNDKYEESTFAEDDQGNNANAEWAKNLAFTEDHKLKRTEGNAYLLWVNLLEWRSVLQYDEVRDLVFFAAPVPEMPGFKPPRPLEPLSDTHYTYIQHWLSRFRGLEIGFDACGRAIKSAAASITVNPLTDYLDSLRWDGVNRLDVWLHHYLGAEDTEQNQSMGRLWLLSCVARARHPGCQADHMLVLEGKQGKGKSSAIRILGGEFYRGNLPSLRDTDKACHAIQGGWIIEVGELDALRGAEGTRVKNFLTQTTDHYRSPYAREYVTRPRRCVFVGTTNEGAYLQDPTGARRFWPVRIEELDRHGLERDRDQLFAEADHLLKQGERWWPTGLDLQAVHEERYLADEWEDRILARLQTSSEVTSDELYDLLSVPMKERNNTTKARLSGIMHRAGYRQDRKRMPNGTRPRVWFKADESEGGPDGPHGTTRVWSNDSEMDSGA